MKLVVLLISSLCLFHVASGVKISCYSTTVEEWSYLGTEIKSCRIGEGANFPSPNLLVDSDGKDGSFQAVGFYEPAKVTYVPHGLLEKFPGMRGLYFHTQPLKVITEEDMKQFGSQIEYIQMWRCQVSFVTKNVFKHNINMKYINFQENPFKYIESGFFESLAKIPTMKQVTFKDCDCINLSIWETKKQLFEVAEIYEADNKHSCNDHKQVPETTVTHSNLECGAFGTNSDSTCKFFVHEEETLMDKIVFAGSTDQKDIKILWICDSVMKYIPFNFGAKLKGLKQLTIESAGLVKVTKKSLTAEMTLLDNLSLTKNSLVNIPHDAFEYLTSLETLDLSYNSIYSFDPVTVKNLSKLKFLYLSGNGIKSIVGDFFDVLPKTIKVVYLQNNGCIDMRFPHDDKTAITKKIKESCTWPAQCLP